MPPTAKAEIDETQVIQDQLKELDTLKARRAPFEPIWDLIARYMFRTKQGFASSDEIYDFYSHDDVLDDTAGKALHNMVSSIDGALWKNGARTFRTVPPRQARKTEENKKFYEEINHRVTFQMEHEQASFGSARKEALLEGGAFGTDAIGVFASKPGSKHKVEYRALSLRNLYIVEDARGKVFKEFYEFKYTAFQLVNEYGDIAKTTKVQALLAANNHETKLRVVWYVRPRENVNPDSEGVDKFSYESLHILADDQIYIRKSGYSGNPIIVTRFYKNEAWEYGFSPGYNALNSTIEVNALVEMVSKGVELSILPSWYVLDDGSYGNGTFDRSPGSVISLDITSSKITGVPPIGQIGTVGQIAPAIKLIEFLVEQINQHFMADKLMDLNNTTRMTLGEAQIRNELRAESTGAIFSQQIDEKITPVIRRTLAVLDEAGILGVRRGSPEAIKIESDGKEPLYIPDELAKLQDQGIEIYNIFYISPAARILRSEELRGVISVWQFAAGFSAAVPELLMRIDKKRSMEMINDLYGAPDDLLLSEEAFNVEMQKLAEAQSVQAQLGAAAAKADIDVKGASANQQNAQAQATLMGANRANNSGGADFAAMVM